jgi:hypothetical protein
MLALLALFLLVAAPAAASPQPHDASMDLGGGDRPEGCEGDWHPIVAGAGICREEFGFFECYSVWVNGERYTMYHCIAY